MVVQLASAATADVLLSYTMDRQSRKSGEIPYLRTSLIFAKDYYPLEVELFNGPDTGSVFDWGVNGIDVLSNVGQTFWIESNEGDPEFSRAVSILAAATPQYPAHVWICYDCTAFPFWVSDRPLQGIAVERFGITINSASLTIEPGTTYPYVYSASITYIFEGSPIVPEPSSFVILIAGLGGFGAMLRRRRR